MKANPAPLVDWYREDVRIQDGGRFIKDTDGLLIQNVTAEDDGIYKCRAIVLDTGNIQDRDIRVEVRAGPIVLRCSDRRRRSRNSSYTPRNGFDVFELGLFFYSAACTRRIFH